MARIELKDVVKRYDTVEVLRDINLDIKDGEFLVLVGPSGCGKSTLLRMIAGLEPITGGDFLIDGQRMNDVRPRDRDIAMVFQSYALYPHMDVARNMGFSMEIRKDPVDDRKSRVKQAAETLGLTALTDRLPKALSGGQRQRVAMGRAIIRDPRAFLFDEPLSNLDAALRVEMRLEIARLHQKLGATMIYVTHDQVEAMTLASRIVVLAGGGISQVGTPLELYEKPANTFVAQFIGSPAMNLLPARIVATGESTRVSLPSGSEIDVPIASAAGLQGAEVALGVRPEDLTIADDDAPALVTSTVQISEKLGEVTVVYLDAVQAFEGDDAQTIAKLPGIYHVARGASLRLTAPADKLHLFNDGVSLRYL